MLNLANFLIQWLLIKNYNPTEGSSRLNNADVQSLVTLNLHCQINIVLCKGTATVELKLALY